MADDLMDFTDTGNDENCIVAEQDENDIPLAPGLVQSPVIVNSILKQSNKDNLIQLYTPIQKPEKGRLKVHFGHDSLLQTPNVRQAKKMTDGVKTIKEEPENSTTGVKFEVEDKENITGQKPHTLDSSKTEDTSDGLEVAKDIVNHMIEQIPIKDDVDSSRSSADSGIDESAMEVSICEPTVYEKTPDLDYNCTDDILLQAELLLKSLQAGSFGSADDETDKPKDIAKDEDIEEKLDTEVKIEKEKVNASSEPECKQEKHKEVTGTDGSVVVSQSNVTEKAETDKKNDDIKVDRVIEKEKDVACVGNEEEPMDFEEAMEVDDEDDNEIIFNIGKNATANSTKEIKEEHVSQTEENLEEIKIKIKEKVDTASEGKEATDENTCNEANDIPCLKTDETVTAEKANNLPFENKDIKDENTISSVIEENDSAEEQNPGQQKCIPEHQKPTEVIDEPAAVVQNSADVLNEKSKATSGKSIDSKKKGEDSSDEEFMSADEDMEVEDVKTPGKSAAAETDIQQNVSIEPKQESPERIPPKVGYNLNLDELDSMDPFASKKSLVNSPDVGKPVGKQKVENKEIVEKLKAEPNDLAETKVEKADKQEHFKSANSSPVKSEPPKAEILLSPNAALVDEACKDKTAGDIIKETSDCLLTDDDNQVNDPEIPLGREGSASETKKELDFDNAEPFKTKTQIANTPDKPKQEQTKLDPENPFKPSKQVMNTPDRAEVKSEATNTQILTDKIAKVEDTHDYTQQIEDKAKAEKKTPSTPQKDVEDRDVPAVSPQIPVTRGAYNLDALDLDDADPFKTKTQMMNSPSGSIGSSQNVDVDPFKPKKQIQNSPEASKEIKKVKPGENGSNAQIKNSPVAKTVATAETDEGKADVKISESEMKDEPEEKKEPAETLEEVEDPFKTKSSMMNSPVKPVDAEEIDPFKQKSQIQNSPAKASSEEAINSFNNVDLDSIDPFKPKKQMQNSPAGDKGLTKRDTDNSNDIDPFKSGSNVQNSPMNKATITTEQNLDLELLDDPFKPKQQMQNSPAPEQPKSESDKDILDLELLDNPFEPKHQMQNSPTINELKSEAKGLESKKTEVSGKDEDKTQTEDNTDPFAEINPFKSKKQLVLSPHSKSDSKSDPFADLNPFQTKAEVANSPEKMEPATDDNGTADFANIDPFKSKSKVTNSPGLQTIEENPFVSKSRIENTPIEEDDPFAQKFEIPTTPTNEPDEQLGGLGDIFEVQSVTRRGLGGPQAGDFGEIDESQFVSASQVFNDPAAWEMLEKLGGAKSDSAESALSRMSLYVKFDPLVDEAPINNPRRISIRVSQLEKVKEYGLDETLLLLGTPPKKRRQSMRATPSGLKSATGMGAQPTSRKAEPVGVTPGAVDLILAYSPKEKEQLEQVSRTKEGPVMALLDDVDASEESENLFQELKYTDADFKRFQRDNKLAMQGMLINKDKEWCKKEKQWEQEKGEIIKKCKQIKQDRDKLEQAFLTLEQTVYQIAAARDTAEKKIQEVTGEKEQALQDIQAVETAFSDLHRRYEKAKTMIMSMKKNEETLKKHTAESQEKQKKLNEKFHALEKSTQEKLTLNKQEIEKLEQQRDSVQSKFDAQMKITNMKIENLETNLQRKTEENKQLTEICDNLLAKVGQ